MHKGGDNIPEEYQTFMRNGKPFTRRLVRNTTHDMSHTRIYSIWKGMRRRCNNPHAPKYEFYGGKGIKVCDEWNRPYGGFENFYKWAIENGYDDTLTIDRIDSSKNYCPENCQRIPFVENIRKSARSRKSPKFKYCGYNKEQNILVIFYCIADFEKIYKVNADRIAKSLNDGSWFKNWKFIKFPIEIANTKESQETIQKWSREDNEQPPEVRVIYK